VINLEISNYSTRSSMSTSSLVFTYRLSRVARSIAKVVESVPQHT